MDNNEEQVEELTKVIDIGHNVEQVLNNPYLKEAFEDCIDNSTEKLADANKEQRDEIACLLRGLFAARTYLYARIRDGKNAQHSLSLLQKAKNTVKHIFQAV